MSGASPLDADAADLLFEEIAAALGEAEPAALPPPAPAAPVLAGTPQPYALGQPGPRGPERLTGLERLGEKAARALRAAVEPLVQARAQVEPGPLALCRFDDWAAKLPFFVSVSHYRLRPLKGGMLVAVDPAFVSQLIERFYGGGAVAAAAPKRTEFTPSEELLLARLLERVVTTLADQWREVTPVEAALVQRETGMAHVAFARADEQVVVQPFTISSADAPPATISIVYPLAMLRPLEEKMVTRLHDEAPSEGAAWRRRLAAALTEVRLPVRSVLARPEITLSTLMSLKPGDVIPIQLAPRTPLLVAARPIAEGQIGEQDGRAALMIEAIGH